MKVNTKIVVNSIIIISFFVLLGVALYVALADDDSPSKGVGQVDPMIATQAAQEWTAAGPVAQEVACSVYNEQDVDREDWLREMTTGENQVSEELANAKIDILEQEC